MKIGFVGLGRMGGNMVRRIRREGDHAVVAFDRSAEAVAEAARHGAAGADSLEGLVERLAPPRAAWVMLPAGAPTESTIDRLAELMDAGDLIVDGGNSRWQDDIRRGADLEARGIDYVDVGTSGGVWGLESGYCMMVGGPEQAVARLAPVLDALAPPDGWAHMGAAGAGHYVKMVHNGVEYGLMQAYAEGFELMHKAPFELDNRQIARLWMQGSVVRSWLLELAERAFAEQGSGLDGLRGHVADSGEGRWTIEEAIDREVPMPAISAALFARFSSRGEGDYAARVLAALREQFGGHAVEAAERPPADQRP